MSMGCSGKGFGYDVTGVEGGVVGVVDLSSIDSSRMIDKCLLLKSTNSLFSNSLLSLLTSPRSGLDDSLWINV